MSDVVIYQDGLPVVEAVTGLGLIVKFDGLRKSKQWTVAIPGIGRGDGDSPKEAAEDLRLNLLPDWLIGND